MNPRAALSSAKLKAPQSSVLVRASHALSSDMSQYAERLTHFLFRNQISRGKACAHLIHQVLKIR
jgi:hypothetical protein